METTTLNDLATLVKVAATVAGATATVISVIAKPLWSKLSKMEKGIEEKLTTVNETLEDVRQKVSEQNGRLGKIETWAKMHEAHDEERHQQNVDTRRELREAIKDVRERMG